MLPSSTPFTTSSTAPNRSRSATPRARATKRLAAGLAIAALSALTATASATVLEQVPERDKALKQCVQLKKLGELPVKKVEDLAKDGQARVWRIQGQRREFVAFIMGVGARAACQVYETGKPAAKLTSVLLPNKGAVQALILHGEVCNDDDGCAAAMLFRERNGTIISAVRTDGCTAGEKLKKIRLFPGNHRSILRICRHRQGKYGYEEVQQILHHDGKQAKVIAEFETGSAAVTAKPKGGGTEVCIRGAPGSVKPGGWGPAPRIKVAVPADDQGVEVDYAVYSWDTKESVFKQGKVSKRKIKLKTKCRVVKGGRPAAPRGK